MRCAFTDAATSQLVLNELSGSRRWENGLTC